MAKRSKKRVVRYEKDHSGCMWGLISIFDFRRHSTRKLIADKKDGSRHASGTGKLNNRFAMLTNLDEGCLDSNDLEKIKTADADKPSVKKVMEKEMAIEQNLKKGKSDMEAEAKQSDFRHEGHLDVGWKTTRKTKKKSSDMDTHHLSSTANLRADSFSHKSSELECVDDLSVDKIVEEFCIEISQKRTSNLKHDEDSEADMQKEYLSNFEDKLAVAVKEFMGQNIVNWKDFTEGQKIQHFKEIAHALQISSFDEELLIKLLRDQNSFLVKYVQNLMDNSAENSEKSKSVLGQVEKSDQLISYKQHKFFRRKVKSQETDPAKKNENTEASNRIVILKPGLTSIGSSDVDKSLQESSKSNSAREKVNTHFLLAELKRKFKHAFGKERLEISANNASSNRIFNDRGDLGGSGKGVVNESSRKQFGSKEKHIEKIIRSSNGSKRGDKNGKLTSFPTRTEQETGDSKKELSNIYIEARKHLSEILSSGDEGVEFLTGHRPKTLGRILSLPEYNYSPIGSPRKDWQQGFVNGEMRYSIGGKSFNVNDHRRSPKRENGEVNISVGKSQLSPFDSRANDIADDKNTEESRRTDEHYTEPEGNEEIGKTSATAICELKNDSDVSSQQFSLSIAIKDQDGDISDTCDDNKNSEFLELESPEEHEVLSPLASPSSSFIIRKSNEDVERTADTQDHLSPVSILEPLLSEEDTSPRDATERPAMLVMQPLQIQFSERDNSRAEQVNELKTILDDKNLIFGYVKKVLLTSGMNQKDFSVKWLSSEQLIDPPLVNEIELFSNQLCCDQQLLFDCINEVLLELCQSYCPWFSSLTRTCTRAVQDYEVYIDEVCKGVYWHIAPLPLPRTLDQLVRKDMERTPNWMELQFDHEIITIEMSELIFKDIVDEVVFSRLCKS